VATFGSTLSRRVSEIVGVALFACALILLIALATYDANDPAWFFSTGTHEVPANFVGRVGAFLGELSYQVFGYASYVIPALVAIAGWHFSGAARLKRYTRSSWARRS
jgi:S-DNA-T family DNA segregation ATPase FtsK/SpoIIIE